MENEKIKGNTAVETEPTAVTVKETEATVTPRSRQWMQEHFTDTNWDSDEAYEEDLYSHLTSTDERLKSYQASDELITRLIAFQSLVG